MESDDFEFRAPQYIDDLGNAMETSQEETDNFFQTLEEANESAACNTPTDQRSPREELFSTPFETPRRDSKAGTPLERTIFKAVRRKSLQPQTEKPLRVLRQDQDAARLTFDGISLAVRNKNHSMLTRLDEAEDGLSLRRRLVTRKRKCASPSIKPPTKFVSLAESAYRFQVLTPPRFHTSTCKSPPKLTKEKLKLTVPLTPQLKTMKRAKEAEAQKHELEALSVPGPSSHPQGRSPEITSEAEDQLGNTPEISAHQSHCGNQTSKRKSKEAKETKYQLYKFKARPVPKSIYTGPRQIRVPAGKAENAGAPLPLGILERSQALLERREESIQKVLEDEKKQRGQFRATPLPSFLASKLSDRSCSTTMNSTNSIWNSTISTICSHSCVDNSPRYQFRAREAAVLKKKPFVPKKAESTLYEISDFELNTERRARDRMNFDQKVKEKEEIADLRKKQEEEAEREAITQETALLRKATVHVAQPLPSFYTKKRSKPN